MSRRFFSSLPELSTATRFALAPVAAVSALLLQVAFFPQARAHPFLLFYVATAAVALLGGRLPGLLAVALSVMLASFALDGSAAASLFDPALDGTALFVGAGAILALLCGSFRAAVIRAERAEKELRIEQERLGESEQRLRAIFDKAALGIAELDPEGRFTVVNERLCQLLGYSHDELLGKNALDVTAPEDRELVRRLNAELTEGRADVAEYEKRCLTCAGDVVWTHVTLSAVRESQGKALFVIGTVEDISDRVRTAAALDTERTRTEAALREADRRKDDFLAMLSHELRNPLAPITNALYLLDHAEPGSERTRHAKAVIGRQVEHMTRLVSDLLDVSRIARGKVQLQCERVDLRGVVSRTLEDHASVLGAREIELRTELPSEAVYVYGDAVRLGQALGNLLHNASKFTHPGGSVTVSLAPDEHGALLRVRDTGAGIAPEMLGEVFEPFIQAERTLDRVSGGLGLGLALVRGIVELHQGTVAIRSEGLGKGTELTLWLPTIAAPSPEVHPEPEPPRSCHRRVLVIEDNVDTAETLKEVLEMEQHDVEIAFSGPDGLAKARSFGPDIVLCDIGLPGMDGYEVARAFRADEELQDIKLVALTGYALAEDQRKAADAGFDRHLVKPPDLSAIERVLAELPQGQPGAPGSPY